MKAGNCAYGCPDDLPDVIPVFPLPAALPLFLAGLAGFGFAGRKRKTA